MIGLISDDKPLINNIFYHTSLNTLNTSKKELLSVTVVKETNLTSKELQEQVTKELKEFCNIENIRFLKQYSIPCALPDISNTQYEMATTETKIKETVFLAGDYLLNGSLNAAMLSGERAAQGLIETLEESRDLAHFVSD